MFINVYDMPCAVGLIVSKDGCPNSFPLSTYILFFTSSGEVHLSLPLVPGLASVTYLTNRTQQK